MRNNTKHVILLVKYNRRVAVDLDRRERRKLRTRQAIQNAAFALFAERGYRETTIAAIAERADVAPRTVTVHFPTKEELLFEYEPFGLESLTERLRSRRPGKTALEALREWMATTMTTVEYVDGRLDETFWQRRALRARVIRAEPELRGRARAGYYEFERVLADAIGDDLGLAGTALIPRVAALTAVTGLREIYESDEARALEPTPTVSDLLALVDQVIAFTQAGVNTATTSR
jgi:AcrR family transcriptional regulator